MQPFVERIFLQQFNEGKEVWYSVVKHMKFFTLLTYILSCAQCISCPSRSTGLDLSLQQRFRWVHFPVKNEPIKNLLGRHLLRSLLNTYGGQLPPAEDPFFKVRYQLTYCYKRSRPFIVHLCSHITSYNIIVFPM